jgi:hypothetical protein
VGKSERNGPLGKPRLINDDNIKIELTETEGKISDSIKLVQYGDGILLSR